MYLDLHDPTNQGTKDSVKSIQLAKQLRAIRIVMFMLPTQNFNIVRNLFILLASVYSHCDQNMMTAESLALLFVPNLFFSEEFVSVHI